MDKADNIIMELLSMIDRKRQLFDMIMVVTQEQKKDIEVNKGSNIGELVDKKQGIIDSIDKIDKVFSEKFIMLKKELDISLLEQADFSRYPQLKALKHKVEDIMSLAKDIMEIEKSNKKQLEVIMDELKSGMKQLSIGKKSIRAYESPRTSNDGIYIDKKK